MPQSRKQFPLALTGERSTLKASRGKAMVSGKASGRLTGGTLTLMCRSLGTPWEIETRGCLLLVEDVNEPAYRLDGMLWQLREAGKFRGIRGVIVGEMIDCKPPGKQAGQVEAVFRDCFKGLEIPVLYHCPVGHGGEIWTLPFGGRVELDTRSKSLTVLQSGLSRRKD